MKKYSPYAIAAAIIFFAVASARPTKAHADWGVYAGTGPCSSIGTQDVYKWAIAGNIPVKIFWYSQWCSIN